jgi:short subunit dehydrogenase-like uncharacterized protein
MSDPRELDLILFGATGFTGRLVAQYLQATASRDGLRWAMAGRSAARLQALAGELGTGPAVPLLVADAGDSPALTALVARARVVVTTVGPYTLHGDALVAACAAAGTDSVDLCGEPLWMADTIARHSATARASGARIVHSCGFDSIPFDLGVVYAQAQAEQRFGAPLVAVQARVRVMKGGFSGGTVASLMATLQAIAARPALAAVMADPFALCEGQRGVPQPDIDRDVEQDAAPGAEPTADGAWHAPFVMAGINTKNVHRTHALRGLPWGPGFTYDERMATGTGPRGRQRAVVMARQARWQRRLLAFGPARALVQRFVLPQPGQGPDAAAREAGRYEIGLRGHTAAGRVLAVTVRGRRDPGYGSTSRLIAEAARSLLLDVDRGMTPGGIWSPGAAMGLALVRRLQAHADLSFSVDD